MTILTLNDETISKLESVGGTAEIRDQSGRVIGSFRRSFTPSDVDQFECPDSNEEIQRRRETGGGRPLADILADLESRS